MFDLIINCYRYVWDKTWPICLVGALCAFALWIGHRLGFIDFTTYKVLQGFIIGFALTSANRAIDDWQKDRRGKSDAA